MEKDKKQLLNVIQESDGQEAEKEIALKQEETQKSGFELPAGYLLAQEMKALFEEDIVTHVQGPSEPEAD